MIYSLMSDTLNLLAVTDNIFSRLAVAAIATLGGSVLIMVGLQNVKTQTAEESGGGRRMVNRAMGGSNTYKGNKAVTMGYVRIVMGVCVILFGIVFIFVGPFLAEGGSRSRPATETATNESNSQPGPPSPWQAGNSNSGNQNSNGPRINTLPALGAPPSAIPSIPYSNDRTLRSNLIGREKGDAFVDLAPDNGMLVGLRIAKGRSFGGVPQAIQPIYQVEDRYVTGNWYGDPQGEQVEALAPAGYAVGALEVSCGLVVTGLSAVFCRVTDNNELDRSDSLQYDFLGNDSGGESKLDARGSIITGLVGYQDGEHLWGVGIEFLRAELPALGQPLPLLAYDASRAMPSEFLGRDDGTEFVDRAPAGGIMVGAIVVRGKNWGGALQAIQPIYEVNGQYVRGQVCGHPGPDEYQILAKPGYAVSGLRLRSGLVLCAAQLAFAPLRGTQLDTNNMYYSESIGTDGGSPVELSGEGRALVGVYGKHKEDLHGLGVYVVERLEPGDERIHALAAARTWTSADDRFSIVATFVRVDEQDVVLRKEDGAIVRIALDKLSDADRKLIEALPAKEESR